MDQKNLMKEDEMNKKLCDANMVSVVDESDSEWLMLAYSKKEFCEGNQPGNLMTYGDSLSYITASTKEKLTAVYPETLADMNHLAEVMETYKDKEVDIQFERGTGHELTEHLLKLAMGKCIGKEKNTITLSLNTGIFVEENCKSEFFALGNESNRFECTITNHSATIEDRITHSNSLFPQLEYTLKVLKNGNQSVGIYGRHDYEKLFESMGWTFDSKMTDWLEKNTVTEFMDLEATPLDNNKYQIIHPDYDFTCDDDSVMMDEADLDAELTEGFNSDEDEPQDIENTKESSEDDKMMTISEGVEGGKSYIMVNYNTGGESDGEVKEMSPDAVLDYVAKSKQQEIVISMGPTSFKDFDHMKKIMKLCTEKEIIIRSYSEGNTGVANEIRKIAMEKCLELENKSLYLSYISNTYEKGDLFDVLLLKSKVSANDFTCEMESEDKSLLPQLVKFLKGIENRKFRVLIELRTHFKKFFKAMGWTLKTEVFDLIQKDPSSHSYTLDEECKGRTDNNKYIIRHAYFDPETDVETYGSNPDNQDLKEIDSEDDEPSFKKRRIYSDYMENVEPVKVASFYANEDNLTPDGTSASVGEVMSQEAEEV